MKWTPENDQLLLLKILETSNVNADVKAISNAWPTDRGDKPTARAITERLVVIRKAAKSNGGGHFSVSSAQTKNNKISGSTPRKPKTAKKDIITPKVNENGNILFNGSTGKRKRNDDEVTPVAVKQESQDIKFAHRDETGKVVNLHGINHSSSNPSSQNTLQDSNSTTPSHVLNPDLNVELLPTPTPSRHNSKRPRYEGTFSPNPLPPLGTFHVNFARDDGMGMGDGYMSDVTVYQEEV